MLAVLCFGKNFFIKYLLNGVKQFFLFFSNLSPLNFAGNSLNRHSRENGNPVRRRRTQLVIDSRFRGNDRKRAFFQRSQSEKSLFV